jgi:hypothetical protein
MLSFMLLVSGLFELFGIVVYEKRHEMRESHSSLIKALRDPTLSNAQKNVALRESGLFGTVFRGLFGIVTLIAAAIFAFKATIFFLLPIWILSLLSEKFRWKENRGLFMLDNFFCAGLFFAAAWTVAGA